jgi:hypothetical protein
MVLKFFSSNEENLEPGGLAYMLKNSTARVLRGNPTITQAVIDASPLRLAQRFTAGVLSGCPNHGSKKEQQLINELEIQLLAGRPAESMPWCVVAHNDKGFEEKHFAIPNFDLVFRKIVHPYVDRIDRNGLRAWLEHYNLRNGLPSPNDRLRIEPDFAHLRIAAEDVEFLRHVWRQVDEWVHAKIVRNRTDLEARLTAAHYRVRCNKHTGGPLDQPVILGPRGNLLRLAGSIYYRPEFGQDNTPTLDLNDPVVVQKRLAELRKTVMNRLDFRAYHLVGRIFGSREQARVHQGPARDHLKSLIDRKLEAERKEIASIPLVDLGYLIRMADGQKNGLLDRLTVIVSQKSNAAAMLQPPTDQPMDGADSFAPDTPSIPASRRPKDDPKEFVPVAKCPVVDPEVFPVNQPHKLEKMRKKKPLPKVVVQDEIRIT